MKTIGIVGGVGPYAGLDLTKKIFDNTEARHDQEHLDVLLINSPRLINDRTSYILAVRDGKVTADPATDPRLSAWEIVHHLIRVLATGGEGAAAEVVARLSAKAEIARELAYRLYALCERKKRAPEALVYNGLVQSWPEIVRLAREGSKPTVEQGALFGETEE